MAQAGSIGVANEVEAAMAIVMAKARGLTLNCWATLMAIGVSSSAAAALTIVWVSATAKRKNPPITMTGPKSPRYRVTCCAASFAAPVFSIATPMGSVAAISTMIGHSTLA